MSLEFYNLKYIQLILSSPLLVTKPASLLNPFKSIICIISLALSHNIPICTDSTPSAQAEF